MYVAGQCLVLLVFWFVVWVVAIVRYRPWSDGSCDTSYLWWMSVPTFAVFAMSSLRAEGQLNWPVAAYLAGAVLVAGRLSEVLQAPWARRGVIRLAVWMAVGIGAVLTVLAHDTRSFTYFVAPFVKEEAHSDTIPMRTYDPASRLKGHRELGKALDELRQQIRNEENGRDPILAGLRWDYPGLLGFYTEGHPQAYSFGLVLKIDRHSQYDLWRPNPVDDPEEFRGRTFLVVGGGYPVDDFKGVFDSVTLHRDVVYSEHGHAVSRWVIFICRNYQGFDPSRRPGAEAQH
jgi:hypothetical protein